MAVEQDCAGRFGEADDGFDEFALPVSLDTRDADDLATVHCERDVVEQVSARSSAFATVRLRSSSTSTSVTELSRVSGVGSSLPTIISASSREVTLLGSSTSPTVLPWRMTVIASACFNTSSSCGR